MSDIVCVTCDKVVHTVIVSDVQDTTLMIVSSRPFKSVFILYFKDTFLNSPDKMKIRFGDTI